MPKPSHREKILTDGLRVLQQRGFAGTSVRDIVKAAGVPQGSFTNHFPSKEAFGLEALNLYFERTQALVGDTLMNEALRPLKRLEAYIDAIDNALSQSCEGGSCLYGNFSMIPGQECPTIHQRLTQITGELHRQIANCLRAAVKAKELPRTTDCDDLASFIGASLQGANLQSRVERSPIPMQRYKRILFGTLLKHS